MYSNTPPISFFPLSFAFLNPLPVEIYIDIMRNTRPSPTARKFIRDNTSADPPSPSLLPSSDNSAEDSWPQDPIRDKYCFFYGTLMDPDILSKVLRSSKPLPIMRPARITGYEIKLWGPYPALIDDKPLHPVDGMVCGLLSPA